MPLLRQTYPTPLGEMVALLSARGLCLLEFSTDTQGLQRECAQVEAARGGPVLGPEAAAAAPAAALAPALALAQRLGLQLQAYFAGRGRHFDLPLDWVGTPFQQQVWQALLTIAYGQTRSYAQQALSIGRPRATRAVAAANGQNKISLIVPCHRVIGSDGSLTGYGGGLARKRWLLALEAGAPGLLPAPAGLIQGN